MTITAFAHVIPLKLQHLLHTNHALITLGGRGVGGIFWPEEANLA